MGIDHILCGCGHSEQDHNMKYTKNFTFLIGNCRECTCELYAIEKIAMAL
jgi:hypothetical protein